MKFEERFKPGDIICADNFHNGKCMIVAELKQSIHSNIFDRSIGVEYKYTCDDLVIDNQRWSAYEHGGSFGSEYNWRIATDDDIVKYLSRFVRIPLGKIGEYYTAYLNDDGIMFNIDIGQLNADELVDLGIIINRYVITEAQDEENKELKDAYDKLLAGLLYK